MVSLYSSSSVEYGIKRIFSIFAFYRELSRFKILGRLDVFQQFFIFFCFFDLILVNFAKYCSNC